MKNKSMQHEQRQHLPNQPTVNAIKLNKEKYIVSNIHALPNAKNQAISSGAPTTTHLEASNNRKQVTQKVNNKKQQSGIGDISCASNQKASLSIKKNQSHNQPTTGKHHSRRLTFGTDKKVESLKDFDNSDTRSQISENHNQIASSLSMSQPLINASPSVNAKDSKASLVITEQDSETKPEAKAEKQNEDNFEDVQEAKAMVGKPLEELKFRKLIKEKLKVTKIPKLMLEDNSGEVQSFNDLYEFKSFLGTGSFGFVVSAIDRASGDMLAIKIVDVQSCNTIHSLKKEAEILQSLPPCNNVIQFKHLREYSKYVIMGIEYARGGTLQDLMHSRLKKKKLLRDDDCAKIMRGILQGLKHIHRNDYVHRDIKPSNVVISDPNQLENLKLVDFGLAVKYQTRQGMDESCGTLVYQAPEQMAGGQFYGKAVDIWAAGFIMYEMIAGYHPLWQRGEDKQQYKEKALKFKKLRYGRRFSKLTQNLIEKLCHPKPSQRYTVDQALQHPWITRNFNDEIPRNHFEQNMYLNDVDEKFRKILNMVYFCSIVKSHDLQQIQQENKQKKVLNEMMKDKMTKTKNASASLSDNRKYEKFIPQNSQNRSFKHTFATQENSVNASLLNNSRVSRQVQAAEQEIFADNRQSQLDKKTESSASLDRQTTPFFQGNKANKVNNDKINDFDQILPNKCQNVNNQIGDYLLNNTPEKQYETENDIKKQEMGGQNGNGKSNGETGVDCAQANKDCLNNDNTSDLKLPQLSFNHSSERCRSQTSLSNINRPNMQSTPIENVKQRLMKNTKSDVQSQNSGTKGPAVQTLNKNLNHSEASFNVPRESQKLNRKKPPLANPGSSKMMQTSSMSVTDNVDGPSARGDYSAHDQTNRTQRSFKITKLTSKRTIDSLGITHSKGAHLGQAGQNAHLETSSKPDKIMSQSISSGDGRLREGGSVVRQNREGAQGKETQSNADSTCNPLASGGRVVEAKAHGGDDIIDKIDQMNDFNNFRKKFNRNKGTKVLSSRHRSRESRRSSNGSQGGVISKKDRSEQAMQANQAISDLDLESNRGRNSYLQSATLLLTPKSKMAHAEATANSNAKDTHQKKITKKNSMMTTTKKEKHGKHHSKSRVQTGPRKSNKQTLHSLATAQDVQINENAKKGRNDAILKVGYGVDLAVDDQFKRTFEKIGNKNQSTEQIFEDKDNPDFITVQATNVTEAENMGKKPFPSLLKARNSSNDVQDVAPHQEINAETAASPNSKIDNMNSKDQIREFSKFDPSAFSGSLLRSSNNQNTIPQIRQKLSQQQLMHNQLVSKQRQTALPQMNQQNLADKISQDPYEPSALSSISGVTAALMQKISDSQTVGSLSQQLQDSSSQQKIHGLQRFNNIAQPYIYGEEKGHQFNNSVNRKLSACNNNKSNNTPLIMPPSLATRNNLRGNGVLSQMRNPPPQTGPQAPNPKTLKSNTPNPQLNRKITSQYQPNLSNNYVESGNNGGNPGPQLSAFKDSAGKAGGISVGAQMHISSYSKDPHNLANRLNSQSNISELDEFSPFENFLLNLLKRNSSDLSPNTAYQNSMIVPPHQNLANSTISALKGSTGKKDLPQKGLGNIGNGLVSAGATNMSSGSSTAKAVSQFQAYKSQQPNSGFNIQSLSQQVTTSSGGANVGSLSAANGMPMIKTQQSVVGGKFSSKNQAKQQAMLVPHALKPLKRW